MKFVVQSKGPHLSRLATLSEFGKLQESFQTPCFFGYTRYGNVPHLTFDVLQKVLPSGFPMMITLPTISGMKKTLMSYPEGFSKFVGLPEYPTYLSIQDPATLTPTGYNEKKGVSIWAHGGRLLFTPEKFMAFVEAIKPDYYQALCDSDTSKDCPSKRLKHAVDRSITFLDECLEIHQKSPHLKDTEILGTIEGGHDLESRIYSATQTAKRNVSGFVIEGFHLNGPEVEKININEFKSLLVTVVNKLPKDKPRILHGAFSPSNILKAIECGVDIFDSSYPFLAAEEGFALTFPLDGSKDTKLDLTDNLYKDDLSPLLEKCECYSCSNFTKAYVHHLLVTSEMLAQVLLMIHNFHHYKLFFNSLQTALSKGTFNLYLDNILDNETIPTKVSPGCKVNAGVTSIKCGNGHSPS